MIGVLFVCHGNICRSPMAESIFAQIIEKNGWEGEVSVSSAAARTDAIGETPYPAARRKLQEKGVPLVPHVARLLTYADAEKYDYIIGMDGYNVRDIERIVGRDRARVCRLLDFTPSPRDIDDPWYTRDFETAFSDIATGCRALAENLRAAHALP